MALPLQFHAKIIVEEGRTTQDSIDSIKDWLKTTTLPELPEEFIILFLLSCKNKINWVKKTIEAYFKTKNAAPEIFNGYNVGSEEMQKIVNVTGFCIIPRRMESNTAIIITKLIDTDYRNCDAVAATKLGCMLFHLCQISNPPNQVIMIMDMEGIGMWHMNCIKMKPMIAFLKYVQEGLPLRVKEIHLLNSNFIVGQALNIFKVFIKSELMQNIKSYSGGLDMERFHTEVVSKAYLPSNYGGNLESFDELMKKSLDDLKRAQPFFEAEANLRFSYEAL